MAWDDPDDGDDEYYEEDEEEEMDIDEENNAIHRYDYDRDHPDPFELPELEHLIIEEFIQHKEFFRDKEVVKKPRKSLLFDEKGFETSKDEIVVIMKALAARTIFGSSAYYRVINAESDETFKKALEVINSSGL